MSQNASNHHRPVASIDTSIQLQNSSLSFLLLLVPHILLQLFWRGLSYNNNNVSVSSLTIHPSIISNISIEYLVSGH